MEERPAKRFKHQSYKDTLKEVHPPSALKNNAFDQELEDSASHFREALERWRELCLSPTFIKFSKKVDPISISMPLLLHHWSEVIDAWLEAVDIGDDEGLKPVLDLLQQISHDLRITLAPRHSEILQILLSILPKALSAPTFTVLLETLSSFIKYVTTPLDLVEETWKAFQIQLPKCNPEVQRAVAELWGTIIRRLKLPIREKCSIAMVENPDVDISAWIFVSACKSVSHTLHTTTPTIFKPLLKYYLSVENPEDVFTVLRRLLTSLAHHCSTSEQYAPLGDVLVEELFSIPTNSETSEPLRRLLELLTVPCSVRKGSRMSAKSLSRLVSHIPTLPVSDLLEPPLLKFTTACLIAGDMSLWMGPGRKVLEWVWCRPTLAFKLCGVLSDLNWGGWKLIALPHVVKQTHTLISNHPKEVLGLLSTAQREKRLESVDEGWKRRLQEWVGQRFQEWSATPDQMEELHFVLTISDLLPCIGPLVVQIISATLQTADPIVDYEQSATNSTWLLGSCLECLSKRKASEWREGVDIGTWTTVIVEKWSWSGFVLAGLNQLIRTVSLKERPSISQNLVDSLLPSILSFSREHRLAVLTLLATPTASSSTRQREVLERCIKGESISIGVEGVRERIVIMGRLGQSIQDDDEVSARIAIRWLIAQLKVNLRPLWSPAAEALGVLSERFGDIVWDLVFQQVKITSEGLDAGSLPAWMSTDADEDHDTIREEERTWRDPSAHHLRVAVSAWLRGDAVQRSIAKVQTIEERFDPNNYKLQLLSALVVFPALVEKHSRDIVPLFLSLSPPDSPTTLPRHELKVWLELFAKFVNPKALRSTESMHTLYVNLLSHPDRPLQRLALTCLLTYKSPHILPYQGTFHTLLDDTRWRDELAQFDLEQIEEIDRTEVTGVLIRLLFGVMLEKKGRSKGGDRRAAVLSTLGGCRPEELRLLVQLMLRPIDPDRGVEMTIDGEYTVKQLRSDVTDKQLVGFLTLLGDVLKNLGTKLVETWPVLLTTLLDIVSSAQRRIRSDESEKEGGGAEDAAEDEADEVEVDESTSPSRSIRTVRQLGLKRFADFFRCPINYDFSPYMKEAFHSFISPRLSLLDSESTQAPSALLELFAVWSTRVDTAVYLTNYDDRVLPKTYSCLIAPNVKPAVVTKVMDIVDNLLTLSSTEEAILNSVFKPHVSLLLTNLSTWVERSKDATSLTDTLGRRQISILSQIATYLTDSAQASMLLSLFIPLLRKPTKLLPEKIKVDLVNITSNLIPLVSELGDSSSTLYSKTYSALSTLLQSLRSRQGRIATALAFKSFSSVDGGLRQIVELLDGLNAYSTKRIEEPDFDRRLEAFNVLNETMHSTLSCTEWLPIIYNMLYFIQDPEELTIRSNAALAMKRFVDRVASGDSEFEASFLKVLYPGLRNGLRSKNELVRSEILGVVSYAVGKCERISFLQEMRPLLAAGDDEANFFNNIHHVQIHRRTRAIRRLVEQCDEGTIRSTLVAEIFIPLVENFIQGAGTTDHHLVNEAIVALGKMCRQLTWGPYYALVQRYLRLTRTSDALGRAYTRTIVAILDNFHFKMDTIVASTDEVPNEVEDEDGGEPVIVDESAQLKIQSHIADAVNTRLLPSLLHHLERRDDAEEALRIPIAIGIAQVALYLPQESKDMQISRLMTVLSQILRSKSQETRDLTRETFCRIAVAVGPSQLPTMFRELRAALTRGPQLHVLAFVIHSILVHVTAEEQASVFHTLDDCVGDISHVAAEVIFGESGKDVVSEGFKTKMREARGSASRGLDTFAILAKFITPHKVSNLLLPVRNIFHETETLRVMQQAEDLLRRIAGGLNANGHLVPKELLVLCHTLVSQNSRFLKEAPAPAKKSKKRKDDAIVHLKRKHAPDSDHYANNSFRFVIFGLELFITAHKRGRFDFKDREVLTRLESLVPVIGNTLYSSHMQVIIPALKAATAILKCPLKAVEKSAPVVTRQMLDIIKKSGSTESDAVQTALKSLATILRELPSAQVKEKDLVFLLELLSPDIEEPSRQASVFAMLRAIVARKFVVPEIYDMMDKVSEVMVTNQSPQVRELCRGVLLQFLLEYPQGKGRLKNHMTFLAKNLSYVYESGRRSVMELLDAILSKFNPSLLREYSDLLFVALVMVIANDEAAKCREMASELIKKLLTRLDDAQRRVVVSHIHSWATQTSQPQLLRVSSQVYGIVIDLLKEEVSPYASSILEDLNAILEYSASSLEEVEDGEDNNAGIDLEWQIPYHAMTALFKLLQVRKELASQKDTVRWSLVASHLLYPHAWVRTISSRLISLLFGAVSVAPPDPGLPDTFPLSRAGMEEVAKKFCLQLRSENLDAALSTQVVKNLFFIGRCFAAVESTEVNHTNEVEPGTESDSESDVEENEDESQPKSGHPLHWLFSKLSYQARSAHIARRNKSISPDNWFHQPASILRWFAAMATFMEPDLTSRFLTHILNPVYRIAEDDSIRDPHIDELKNLAVELQELVQTKVGTTKFSTVYSRIRQNVTILRRERKVSRARQVTTNPAAAAKRKLARNVAKKDSRKRKHQSFTEGSLKRRRAV